MAIYNALRMVITMEKSTVKITICGANYFINTDDKPEYVESLGAQLDERLSKILKSGSHISVTQAAILTALQFADLAKKAEDTADNLRSQLKDYLEDAAKARSERDFYRREADRLKAGGGNNSGQNNIWN